jgi:glyoxylase-like metal-dependent hydrolase (beta-lactamase superfamily II)
MPIDARNLLALALAIVATACGGTGVVGQTPGGAPIVRITLSQSNAYLVKTPTPVLIDAGTVGDTPELARGLAEAGTSLRDIALVVVTHAHHDHAGLAAELQRDWGTKVMLGAGDLPAAARGHDDDLRPTGTTGALLKPFLPKVFPEISPDIVVRDPVDLRPWGIEGQVLPLPGHTPGSIVVVLANHAAFVGDVMLGGWLGGALFASRPGEHYYQADPAQNRRNITSLLAMGIDRFYLGHGGPVSGVDVAAAFPR